MTTIYLIRHAEAEGNLYRRAQGGFDSLITPLGYKQIKALEKRFENINIDKVYSSPLFRTRTTAKSICEPKHLVPHILPDLQEIDVGPWEDIPWGEIDIRWHKELDAFNNRLEEFYIEGGETAADLQKRMVNAINTIIAESRGLTVAAFSHGMAIRLLLAAVKGIAIKDIGAMLPHGDNTSVSRLEVADDGKITVAVTNDTSHLGEGLSTFAKQSWWREKGERSDPSLHFVPINAEKNKEFYIFCRGEAWLSSHGTMDGFDGEMFLKQLEENVKHYPEALIAAYDEDKFAGLLQLDTETDKQEKVGRIPFVYMNSQYRKKGAGIQLIGEAVSRYRKLGRTKLRLRCAVENGTAQRFYERNGFVKIGMDEKAKVSLDILEKNIGCGEY